MAGGEKAIGGDAEQVVSLIDQAIILSAREVQAPVRGNHWQSNYEAVIS